MLLCIYLLDEGLLITHAVFLNVPLHIHSSKETNKTKKKEIKQRLNDATISQLPLPQLLFVIFLSFLSESDATKALHFLLLGEKCLAQVQIKNIC